MQKPRFPSPSPTAAAGDHRDPPAVAARPEPGELFADRYEIRSRLGSGGMADVMLARDTALGRLVALKLIAPALAADPLFVERLRREATAVASLNHPNVVVIYDHGVAGGQPYIAMEYVAGRTLKEIIAVAAPLPPATAVAYACQMLDGLAAAHAVGIVHRDIKPENLVVRDDGVLKVADFGVARAAGETVLTEHGSVIGTAGYISPEQARGEVATPASDLYSAGVVVFELLTSALPFRGELPLAVATQHVLTPPPSVLQVNPAVPIALARVVGNALCKDPRRRYRSATEMRAALEAPLPAPSRTTRVAPTERMPAAAATTRVLRRAPLATPHRARRPSRRTALLAALAAAALLIGSAFVFATGGAARPDRVAVPRVIGKPVAAAAALLRRRGFAVRIAPSVHTNGLAGTVAAARPNLTSATAGATITVIPSSGPRAITVPPVSGFSQAAAVTALRRLGLTVRQSAVYGSAPVGTAIATTPAAGAQVAPQSPVALSISAGPPPPASDVQTPQQPAQATGSAKGDGHGQGHGHEKNKHNNGGGGGD